MEGNFKDSVTIEQSPLPLIEKLSLTENVKTLLSRVDLGLLMPHEKLEKTFYCHFDYSIGQRIFNVEIDFKFESEMSRMDLFDSKTDTGGFYSRLEETLQIQVMKPFDTHFDFQYQLKPKEQKIQEIMQVCFQIENISGKPFVIDDVQFIMKTNTYHLLKEIPKKQIELFSHLNESGEMKHNGQYRYVLYFQPSLNYTPQFAKVEEEQPTSPLSIKQQQLLGNLTLKWKRKNSDQWQDLKFNCPFPNAPQLLIDYSYDSVIYQNQPTPLTFYFLNRHKYEPMKIQLSIEVPESFLYAGPKQFQLLLLPGRLREQKCMLWPIGSGRVKLPVLNWQVIDSQGALGEQLKMERFVFISDKPNKGN